MDILSDKIVSKSLYWTFRVIYIDLVVSTKVFINKFHSVIFS